MKTRISLAAMILPLLACCRLAALGQNPAATPAPATPQIWADRWKEKLARVRQGDLDLILVGDSIEALDTDAVKVGEDSVTVKAKDGKSLDLAPVLTAMEKGGFSASKVVIGTAAAKSKAETKKVVRR